jgi:hypothetical protein
VCKQNCRTVLFSVYFMSNLPLFYNYKISQNETIYSPIPIHTVTARHIPVVRLRQEFSSRWGNIYILRIIYRGQLDRAALKPLCHGTGCLENKLTLFL